MNRHAKNAAAQSSPPRPSRGYGRRIQRAVLPSIFGVLAVLLWSCGPKKPTEIAAHDVEIERAVLWEFRNDRRFDDIQVSCREGVVTLRGRVDSREIGEEALERAREASDAKVVSALEIRPR